MSLLIGIVLTLLAIYLCLMIGSGFLALYFLKRLTKEV